MVSQCRNGRTTNQTTTTSATIQITPPAAGAPAAGRDGRGEPASAATRISQTAGSSSALTWVRVRDDDVLALVEELAGRSPPRGSCHAVTRRGRAHVDDVAGAQRTCPVVPSSTTQPALVVDVRRPGRRSGAAAGQVDPDVAAERRARAARTPRAARRSPPAPPARRSSPRSAREHRRQQRRCGRASAPVERQRGGRRRPAARRAVGTTLSPMPTTAAGPAGRLDPLDQDPAELAVVDAARRWATSAPRRRPARAQRRRRRRTRSAAAATATARPATLGRSSTEKVSARPGRRHPARSSRPRPAVWCSATTTRPSRRPGAGPLGDERVGRRASRRRTSTRQAGERRRAVRVERWARGAGRRHGH